MSEIFQQCLRTRDRRENRGLVLSNVHILLPKIHPRSLGNHDIGQHTYFNRKLQTHSCYFER